MDVRIAALIPARLYSSRFPGKVMFPFFALPMVEHVRRRVLLCPGLSDVVVATCDPEVAEPVQAFGGSVVMTSSAHPTGTDRVAEALRSVDCTHVLIVQADEVLVLPEQLQQVVDAVRQHPEVRAWNATAPIAGQEDLEDRSVVKGVVSRSGKILLCSRKSPCLGGLAVQRIFMRKILGLIAFERDFLLDLTARLPAPLETSESVEQSRILEYDGELRSIDLSVSYPSVNLRTDVALVEGALAGDSIQRQVLARILQPGAHG